jgi:hypothetical protein
LHIACTRFGVGISSIAEEVDVDMGDFEFLGDFDESVEMILLGVLATF